MELLNRGECEVVKEGEVASAAEGHAKRFKVIESDRDCWIVRVRTLVPYDEAAGAEGSALRE
jgi:hypothetical protein